MQTSKAIWILMVINAFILGALLQTPSSQKLLAQDSTASSNGIIFSHNPLHKNEFYIINTESKLILSYQKNTKDGIILQSYRSYEHDQALKTAGTFKVANNYKTVVHATTPNPKK